MPVILKTNLTLNKLIPDIKSNFAKDSAKDVKKLITDEILSGKSPVAGGEYKRTYSDSYAKTKGRRSPVDLKVTGKLLRSIKSFITARGNVSIFFSSPIAKFHDLPGLARVLRQMLPKGSQVFIGKIQNRIVKGYDDAVGKAVNKQNR